MSLSASALAQLARLDLGVEVGDIWHIPQEHLNFCSDSSHRFCLLVRLEPARSQGVPVRAHFIVGSHQKGSKPRLIVQPGEIPGWSEPTYFSFWTSSPVDLTVLRALGARSWRGRLAASRLSEIEAAIAATKPPRLIAIKRLPPT